MLKRNQPAALTIAGSDSGGEAGIQADLQTFARLGVHGTTAITCLTAQNPGAVARLHPCPAAMVRAQIESVIGHYPVRAAKTGMLYSAAIVREVARYFRRHRSIPLVVDPVMVSTSGRRLLQADGIRALQKDLLPVTTLVTPNLAEAEILLGRQIASLEELRGAAMDIHRKFGCAALVKGGHLANSREAADFFYGAGGEWMISAPRITNVKLHGTGCIYSAAITAGLARGMSLIKAIEMAKNEISACIEEARRR